MIEISNEEISGLEYAFLGARLSYNSESKGLDSDLALLKKLVIRGNSHSKALRMVDVWAEIRAPRYWWQEMATYRVGVEMVSESTMHTLMRGVTQYDFVGRFAYTNAAAIQCLIDEGAELSEVKANLPEGFLQTRIMKFSYTALRAIYFDRRGHRLQEWRTFCKWIEALPYAAELITATKE